VDYNNGNAQFQKIIEMPGIKADSIFKVVNRWVIDVYNNPDKVISGTIKNEMIKGSGAAVDGVNLSMGVFGTLRYGFTIDVKDEKVRYTMSNLQVGNYSFEMYVFKKDGTMRTSAQSINVNQSVTSIANNLITSLENSFITRVKDDW
jgi:hypothetical protein